MADPGSKARKSDEAWKRLPDLLIVDGGKGQLSVAVEVLAEYGLTEVVPVAGLAKQREELFLPGRPDSILLPPSSQGLFLVQRIRDEAHRFAITAHRAKRSKMAVASALDAVPGIGPARRKALAQAFRLAGGGAPGFCGGAGRCARHDNGCGAKRAGGAVKC